MAQHVCPVWVGYLLASPVRKLFQNPKRILAPYIRSGMTVVDVGCAMGFFTIPAAGMVGADGRVIAVDMQPRMIDKLKKRADKAGVGDRIETRVCTTDSPGLSDLEGRVDLALAFAMVHETPDPARLLRELGQCLKPEGRLLVAEPRGHVTSTMFDETLRWAGDAGLRLVDRPAVSKSHSAVFVKPAA